MKVDWESGSFWSFSSPTPIKINSVFRPESWTLTDIITAYFWYLKNSK